MDVPVAPTYPGVYIQEIPSGVRTITGVATAITAFIGRALRGPVNTPVTINSFGDFERTFGGLWLDSPMSYAVRDFYLNGGSQALIVRLFHPSDSDRQSVQNAAQGVADAAATAAGQDEASAATVAKAARDQANASENAAEPRKTAADTVATAAETAAAVTRPRATPQSVSQAAAGAVQGVVLPDGKAHLMVDTLSLEAADPGSWGNSLTATVNRDGITDEVAERYRLSKGDLFNVVVTYRDITERFSNVSCAEGPRRLDRVLSQSSQLVRVQGTLPSAPPKDTPTKNDEGKAIPPPSFSGGADSTALVDTDYTGSQNEKTGLYALEHADLFNLLCLPPDSRSGDTSATVYQTALTYCVQRRAMLIVDPPAAWNSAADAVSHLTDVGLSGDAARNAALYFPRVIQADPLREGQLDAFVPCGLVAGTMARTDTQRGVWKAPAGIDAAINGSQGLAVNLTDAENGQLNPLGINCLRAFPVVGRVLWGARTLRGADQLADEYKYISVRRLALYIEESLYRGTQWVVFEPNDEPLWAQIRLNLGAFMQNLFRQGAFQGRTPREAYFVKCDRETTTQNDVNLGIVNIIVGFAPLKPAEFVIISLQQMAGQIQA
jgi:phage tail sheath protein FI